jgi:formamidopyrimidine-DNA glycosylase
MPELPEVETTLRGIQPHLAGQRIVEIIIRQPKLRWPVPHGLNQRLTGEKIESLSRRGKYLLLQTGAGTLILHLGMSGSLRLVDRKESAGKHDHFDIVLENGKALRLTDPRRFGALQFTRDDPAVHELIAHLGPEPLSNDFSATTLFAKSRGRKVAIKQFIMDSKVVVGVGNIYANESLFLAGINPKTAAGRISLARYERLVASIKQVLAKAITQGGTTLRDFVGGDGRPGYFAQALKVYGREGEPCSTCGNPIRQITQGQRSTYYCPRCQK